MSQDLNMSPTGDVKTNRMETRNMSKKDYNLIAQAIADTYCDSAAQLAIAEKIADRLADENPLFDKQRFLAACGVA